MSVAALLLGDSRFPAGGHAHSGGVEPAVTAGIVSDLETLEAFLRGRLRTAGLVAAGIAACACERARGTAAQVPGTSGRAGSLKTGTAGNLGGPPAVEAGGQSPELAADDFWAFLDAEADARTPSPAQREASRRQGRALLRAARAAWPDAAGLRALATGRAGVASGASPGAPRVPRVPEASRTLGLFGDSGSPQGAGRSESARGSGGAGGFGTRVEYRGGPHHAVVLGAATAAAGAGPAEAARIAAYQAAAGPASAAVRLLALDPMRATAVLARLAGEIDQVAEHGAACAGGPLSDLPSASAPALDLLAEAHIRAEVRLFES